MLCKASVSYRPRVPPVSPHHHEQAGHFPRQAVPEVGGDLYEETGTSRSGYSYLGMVEGTLNMVLGRENDRYMREIHIKLEGFVREYSVEEGVEGGGGGVQEGRRGEVMNNNGCFCLYSIYIYLIYLVIITYILNVSELSRKTLSSSSWPW